MKRILMIGLMLALMFGTLHAQLKSQDDHMSASESLVHPTQSISNFLGLLNSDNFMMRHNFSLSYMSSGGQGMSLASYTNSMFFRIADPLNVRFDLTLQGSPFGQYGSLGQGNFNKLLISRAELNYHPTENMFISLQFNQRPFGYYNGYYNGFYGGQMNDEFSPFSRTSQTGEH